MKYPFKAGVWVKCNYRFTDRGYEQFLEPFAVVKKYRKDPYSGDCKMWIIGVDDVSFIPEDFYKIPNTDVINRRREKRKVRSEKKRLYDNEYREKQKEIIKIRGKKYRDENKEMIGQKKKVYFRKNKKRILDGWNRNVLKHRFGITIHQYEQILRDQGSVCKICKQFRLQRLQRRMGVDHCHKTGKIRGILCAWCNSAIGNFGDDINLLKIAINYLKEDGNDISIGELIDTSKYSPKSKSPKKRMNRFITNRCHCSFVNLDHRKDRLLHMFSALNKAGINASRTRGVLPSEVHEDLTPFKTMLDRTPGALGCHLAQVDIMKESLIRRKNAFVMEDDLIFCSDIQDRFDYIEKFLSSHEWDIFWLGGTYSVAPPYWHKHGHNSELTQCRCTLGRDAECTDDPRIMRTYGCFSTFAYIVNVNSIPKILKLIEENVHFSIGIDFLFIYLQPILKTYSFAPGCVFQIDNISDIGSGMTYFTPFLKINGTLENSAYVYQDRMEDFDPSTFNFAEAKI